MKPLEAGRPDGPMRRAAWWRLAGLLFERPRPGWHGEVAALAAEIDDPALCAAAAAARDAEEGAYLRLFGPGGSVSPREVAHRGLADPGRVLAKLAGLYGAFAYRPRAEDPHDHIAVEIGFAGFLALKEAYGLAWSEGKGVETARRALRLFLEEHLGPFAGSLAPRLEAATSPPLHVARAAPLLVGRLAALGVETGPPRPAPGAGLPVLRPEAADEDALVCGEECGALPPD